MKEMDLTNVNQLEQIKTKDLITNVKIHSP